MKPFVPPVELNSPVDTDVRFICLTDLLHVWENYLWPNRTSPIELTSAIKYGKFPYEYDTTYMDMPCMSLGIFVNGEIAGVNSYHRTGNSVRSRGLYVFEEFRGNNLGARLLAETINQARLSGFEYVWSMPRMSAYRAYSRAGFNQTSDWFKTETSNANCFVRTECLQ